ncbi:peptidylprolyl isomerase [Coraliomargarita akajimensis]|uniref:Uncharacterized protein n=1 Tax=Coraliomargarita akajimensis (strain DSM 45221 / IAM 15411 / JCM 23193 / KCTC 12865 / 04OKA010-24) TaxID=583355 RepID=D5EHS7_CORAD|nr:peptidyl-prolyl cis-trans isomerase [Coraliomargarita akajimensis]ADE54118.1 conserved hypothetical protein [Coraliomargarita akajimensis DSM 45221]
MISWIQHHLIRHGRWIFITLLVIIVVAFVFTIGNTPGCTTNRSTYQAQNFFGYDLNSPRDRQILGQKVNLSSIINTGRPIVSDQQYQVQLPQRIAMLFLAGQLGIPTPTQEELSEYIQTKPIFFGPDGQFSRDTFTNVTDNLESNPEFPRGLFVTVLEEDYRIDQVRAVVSGPGFVLPAEARVQTQRNQTSYKLSTASLAYSTFSPELAPAEADLKAYYETNKQSYEIPVRVKSEYVLFKSEAYLDSSKTYDESELRDHFIANRARFVSEYEAKQPQAEPAAEGEAAPEKAAVTYENVKDAVAQDYALVQAAKTANNAAQAFALTLYNDFIEQDSEAFKALLAEYKVSLQAVEPFTQADTAQRNLPAEMLTEAFSLPSNRYYTSAYPTADGYAVLFRTGTIPAEIPPFEVVAAEVTTAYKADEKRKLFNDNGLRLKDELDTQLSAGKSFKEAAEGLGLQVQSFDRFEFTEAPAELNRSALDQAQNLEAGAVSSMISTQDDLGLFVFVEEKIVPEITDENEDFAQAEQWLSQLSQYISATALSSELMSQGTEVE